MKTQAPGTYMILGEEAMKLYLEFIRKCIEIEKKQKPFPLHLLKKDFEHTVDMPEYKWNLDEKH